MEDTDKTKSNMQIHDYKMWNVQKKKMMLQSRITGYPTKKEWLKTKSEMSRKLELKEPSHGKKEGQNILKKGTE